MSMSFDDWGVILSDIFTLPPESVSSNAAVPYVCTYQHFGTGMPESTCRLCDVEELTNDELEAHFQSASHQEKLVLFRRDLNRIMKMSYRWCRLFSEPLLGTSCTMDGIGDPSAREAIRANLYSALVTMQDYNDARLTTHLVLDRRMFGSSLSPILAKIGTLEQHERLLLLALTVWKGQCIVNMDAASYLVGQEWARSGWKSRKDEHRTSNAIAIVVLAVRPFVE